MLSKTTMFRRSSVSRITLALLLGVGLAGATGCKSGVGERCQINSDCDDGLVCAKTTDTCVESVNQGVDGGIDAPLDASTIDGAPPTDAPVEVDAAIDAAIDAT
jgi:hypothetical protein